MKNNTPAVLWYYQDFETGTMLMTMEEKGLYVTLLDLQNIKGRFTMSDIQRLLPSYFIDGAPNDPLENVLDKFIQDDGDQYFNPRMEGEIAKRNRYKESRSNNRKGCESQQHMKQHMNEHMNEHMETCRHMETETEIETETKNNNKKEQKSEPDRLTVDVVTYLNEKAGTAYRAATKSTARNIKARANEGYSLADFQKVIDTKTEEWAGTDMEKYLRPETLFGSKFESYLNQRPRKKTTGNPFLDMLEDQTNDTTRNN